MRLLGFTLSKLGCVVEIERHAVPGSEDYFVECITLTTERPNWNRLGSVDCDPVESPCDPPQS